MTLTAPLSFLRLPDRKGMEVSALVTLLVILVFLVVALIIVIAMWDKNPLPGLCDMTFGFLRGCA